MLMLCHKGLVPSVVKKVMSMFYHHKSWLKKRMKPLLLSKHPPNELQQLQVSDDPIGLFLKSVEEGKCPKVDDLRRLGPEDQCLGRDW